MASAEFNRALPDGLHVSHFIIVEHLAKNRKSQTPHDLARVFQVSKQNMTNSIAQLAKRGLIEVAENPMDGRSKLVAITDKGRAFRDRAIAALGPVLTEVAGHEAFLHLDATLPAMQSLRTFLDERRNGTDVPRTTSE